MKWLLVLIAAFALTASAADISGTWKATAEGPQGSMERTFVFKVDGNKVTGETQSQMLGKSTINDGKIDGDNLSFSITVNLGGNEMKVNYTGKVGATEMKLKAEITGSDQTIEWTAKKTQ